MSSKSPKDFDIRYDRRVSPEFLKHFTNGFAVPLVEMAKNAAAPLALDRCRAVLGTGHPQGVRSHGTTEGVVQSALSKATANDLVMLDREVTPSFRDQATKSRIIKACMAPLVEAVAGANVKATNRPQKFGTECDLLAVDQDGRLLAVEVKPLDAGSIAWVPAQAAMYASVLQRWIRDDAAASDGYKPREVIAGMLHQRRRLGHAPGFTVELPRSLTVTPVVALQRGASAAKKDQMLAVRDELVDAETGVPPVELYEVSITGRLTRIS